MRVMGPLANRNKDSLTNIGVGLEKMGVKKAVYWAKDNPDYWSVYYTYLGLIAILI